ncbi:MAG: hypothetical protein M1160_03940 [Candidatus Marsarchaeota archaeon]|jgi:lysyl-tRNA synthetase class 2|nr:hypothetical protein [Candidatus Marsarchaeota archaeon]MCL5111993.1 hypothetical protein [Candidatus Marsarchaeota archaeon]
MNKDKAANLRRGDIVEVTGRETASEKRQNTLAVKNIKILGRTSAGISGVKKDFNLENKRHNIVDELFGMRSIYIWNIKNELVRRLRDIMYDEGMTQIYAPVFNYYRGTQNVEPFVTFAKDGSQRYLRITQEMYHKRVLAATMAPIFEFGSVFRRIGTNKDRGEEYLVLELAYPQWKIKDLIRLISEIWNKVRTIPKLEEFHCIENFKEKLHVSTFDEVIKKNKSIYSPKQDEIASIIDESYAPFNLNDKLKMEFDKQIKPKIMGPEIIVDYPIGSPLAKQEAGKSLELEWVLGGVSIAHGYEDETDPRIVNERFMQQLNILESKGIKAEIDADFMDALDTGVPPSASLAIGVDRLVEVLVGATNLRSIARLF